MKVVRKVALVVDWVIAVAVSMAALGLVFQVAWGGRGASLWPVEVMLGLGGWGVSALALAALIVLALNFVAFWESARGILWSPYLRIQSDDSRVNVSVRAIEDSLQRALLGLEEVSAARVTLTPPGRPGRPVIIRAYVTLRESVVYHSISRGIISVLEAKFNDIVSAGAPVECQVYWEKIKHEGGRSGASRPLPGDSLRPQFPIGEDQET